ncbi:hypothetical protein [Propionivibrio sp.]|uniref:hypothetical protein n=1 Tax=Propionivibrio sp. TaxID=2212460 RepID=UPI00262AB6F2|nr:hypothetical protein [Propionivibrio sp.]
MRKILILIVVFMAVAATPLSAQTPVAVLQAEFGLFDASNPRELRFEPANVVPHKVGQRYGWIIEVGTARRTLSVREEYLLPTEVEIPNDTDPVSESLSIRPQRRNQVSQRQLVPVDGKIYGEWAVGPSEPAGHRHLQVIIEGQVAASFEFDVK